MTSSDVFCCRNISVQRRRRKQPRRPLPRSTSTRTWRPMQQTGSRQRTPPSSESCRSSRASLPGFSPSGCWTMEPAPGQQVRSQGALRHCMGKAAAEEDPGETKEGIQ